MDLVILGSAREDSNTLKAVHKFCPLPEGAFEIVELHKLKISHYNYGEPYPDDDDFVEIAIKMQKANTIVFATPVYWYAMSGRMKVFFDRLTQLLYQHKPIGKSLAGKKTYLIATGSDPELPEGFEVPFRRTSEYFEMEYVKAFYQSVK